MEYNTNENLPDLDLLDKERKLFYSVSTNKLVDLYNNTTLEMTNIADQLVPYGYTLKVLHNYKNLANFRSFYRHNVPPQTFGAYLAFINNYIILIVISNLNTPNLLLQIHRITIQNNLVESINIPFSPQQNWEPIVVPAYIIPLPEDNGVPYIVNLWTFEIVPMPLIISKDYVDDKFVYTYNYEIFGIYPYMFMKIKKGEGYDLYSINDNKFLFQNAKWIKIYTDIIVCQSSDDKTVIFEPLSTYYIYTYFHSYLNNEIIVYANRNTEEYEGKFNSTTYSGDLSLLNTLLDKYLYDNKTTTFSYTPNSIDINLNNQIVLTINKTTNTSFDYKLNPMDSLYSFFQSKFIENNIPVISLDGVNFSEIYEYNEI